jgi:hypothetical protein
MSAATHELSVRRGRRDRRARRGLRLELIVAVADGLI